MARELVKTRAVLTDEELMIYLAYQSRDERRHDAVLERQVAACLARMFGGLRTHDLVSLKWEHFETEAGRFGWGWAPRKKRHGRRDRWWCPRCSDLSSETGGSARAGQPRGWCFP